MQEFINWTVDTIREDKLLGSWLDERKYDWLPLTSKAISNIIDNGKSVLIITDKEREWFLHYVLSNINKTKNGRPLLPFYDFNSFNSNIDNIKTENDIELIKDMLSISFPNGYFFWYIGKSQSKRANLAKISKKPLLWIMDEELPNAFVLRSNDESLDMKLLQMYRLFDKTISGVLFADVDVLK
ncbi:MAG: HobA family DNA replication regulator [Campylobacterales bacterium]|nr:HobA family DNA replication regulator [Campylobacterales bacterium]